MVRSGTERRISPLGNEHGELPRGCDGRKCSVFCSLIGFAAFRLPCTVKTCVLVVQSPELKESSTAQSPPACPAETSGLCSWGAELTPNPALGDAGTGLEIEAVPSTWHCYT